MKPGPAADRVLLIHIQECLSRIADYTQGGRAAFLATPLVQDAVVRNLQTLSESSQRLSATIKGTQPQIPWLEIAGFRNVITHGYLGLDLSMVWSVIEMDLPALAPAIVKMRKHVDGDASAL